ncbi:adenylosuccinate synthetase [Formosa haliotis]|uniref:adenylosuccinate synthetase n=1 Tax=Formosa haliotis TaxID=1555194 RepID=UPI0008243D55|nr:adenylosuccinate synthetase [Formosa haliotis]
MKNTINILLMQLPIGTPSPDNNSPIDFSDPFNIIVFIILPIVAVVLYFYWKKTKHRDNE